MNKTVNINLANILFHIDEKAFNKLQRYLEAIKKSFMGTTGSDEIIADIEARIAELFHEKMESERQVITEKEVDEVITIMGQPEDYMVDDDIFEDRPRNQEVGRSRVKKLYRDIDNKYIAGVCSGLEHYLGIDALWIRIIFIVLTLSTGFGFALAYIILWILVPEAQTTAQKLDMRGEPVNISNIERKVKEGLDDVADKVKSVDYQKVGDKVKSSSKTFFDTVGDVFLFLFKIFAKFIGIILIIVGACTIIGLFISLFTVGVLDVIHVPGLEFKDMMNYTDAPFWLVSLFTFFAVGIPFFFLLYLGLKILVNNLKSIGLVAKLSLLGLWLISIIGLIVLGVKQAAAHGYSGSVTQNESIYFPQEADTLNVFLTSDEIADTSDNIRLNNMTLIFDEAGNKLLLSDDVRVDIKRAKDSLPSLRIRKDAEGSSFNEARDRAGQINYNYSLSGHTLMLNDYFTTDAKQKIRNQEVRLTLFLPEGKTVRFNEQARYHLGRGTRYDKDLYRSDIVDYYWRMGPAGKLICLNCPADVEEDYEEDSQIIIDENGVNINIQDRDDTFKLKIDDDGVQVKTEENR